MFANRNGDNFPSGDPNSLMPRRGLFRGFFGR
jgi:hypothetical protein